eukprot:3913264-Alexandrium_andersonii.AAC.1
MFHVDMSGNGRLFHAARGWPTYATACSQRSRTHESSVAHLEEHRKDSLTSLLANHTSASWAPHELEPRPV